MIKRKNPARQKKTPLHCFTKQKHQQLIDINKNPASWFGHGLTCSASLEPAGGLPTRTAPGILEDSPWLGEAVVLFGDLFKLHVLQNMTFSPGATATALKERAWMGYQDPLDITWGEAKPRPSTPLDAGKIGKSRWMAFISRLHAGNAYHKPTGRPWLIKHDITKMNQDKTACF